MSDRQDMNDVASSEQDGRLARYDRQVRYPPIGQAGQERLLAARILICGCGALGSVLADILARAGAGHLRLVDRDFLELNNLQRQVLYDEDDLAAALPKSVAAARKLARINSAIEVEPIVADVDHTNVERLCDGVDVIVDGTDNFETRFLLNDACAKRGIPWVYGGCLGAEGQTMTIIPGKTGCLRCLIPEVPPPGTTPTCDTAGVLGSIVHVVASLQALEAIKIAVGRSDAVSPFLTVVDLWENRVRQIRTDTLKNKGDCPTCQKREFPWLSGERGSRSAVLCGRHAVQLSPPQAERLSLDLLERKVAASGPVQRNAYLLRLAVDGYVVTVFADGRAIVSGTNDPALARSIYARYIGH